MQRQLNQMQLAQRAWVTATFRVASLVKNDYGVDLGTYIDLKNVGRAPAEHVFVSARLIPDDFESALIVQREVCSQTNSLKLINESPSNTIFPEDSEETNAVSISTVKEIREYQRSVVAQRLKGNPRPSEKDINAYRETAVFSVVGCVSYMFEGSQKVHQTGFVLGLSLGEAEGGTAIPALVNTTRNGTLPDAEIRKLRLSQRLYGAFAN